MTDEKRDGTAYVILHETGGTWDREDGTVVAASADAAIRAHLERCPQASSSGFYVAVPARSWNSRHVRTETTVRLVLDEILAESTGP